MRSGLTKLTGALVGALLLAGVIVPATTSGAAPTAPASHTVTETGCGANGPISGTVTTATDRGVTTTKTTYDGEITTTVIVPAGTPVARAKFMASDKAGNEYFATTRALATAAATAFNRANPGRAIGNGVVYYARTKILAEIAAQDNDTMGYVNGVPVSSTPQYLATSRNGTAFWSNCSQTRANALASLDTNRAPRKVWHATNTSTGQHVTSTVSAKAATALAAYHYVGYVNGEVAAYGFNCQVLTAMSYGGLITALQAQIAATPFVSYGGDFLGYDTTGTNPADMQMFRGATQDQANALAYAFGKSLVRGGVFVVDKYGLCATVGPNVKEVMAIQNIEPYGVWIDPVVFSIGPYPAAIVPATTGLKGIWDSSINVGGQLVGLSSDMELSSTSSSITSNANALVFNAGTFDMSWNMTFYDQGYINGTINPSPPIPELTTPFTTAHAALPTQTITCVPYTTALAGAPASVTLLSYNCPSYYHPEATP